MELVVDQDALAQLAELLPRQEVLQLRLAHEDNLEKLLLVGLQV